MFGVPLSVNIRNMGQALPPAILHAIKHLRETGGLETKGIFRRAAAKAKIELLKVTNEANPGAWTCGRVCVCVCVFVVCVYVCVYLSVCVCYLPSWSSPLSFIERYNWTCEINFSAANANYGDYTAYDIADMIKLYFRELPEPVLTARLSEMLIVIQQSE